MQVLLHGRIMGNSRSSRKRPAIRLVARAPGPAGLLWTLTEMWWNSATVIAHRTARIAAAGHPLSAADRKEFALMWSEKGAAGLASWGRVASQSRPSDAMLSSQLAAATADVARACGLLWTSRSPQQLMTRQSALMRSVSAATTVAVRASNRFVGLSHGAVHPYHRASAANAKRLARLR